MPSLWTRLPAFLALPILSVIRRRQRRENLHDTSTVEASGFPQLPAPTPRQQRARTIDGAYNDLSTPAMGAAGTRFGRNVPLTEAIPDSGPTLLTPSPRTVSLELLTRDRFKPATSLNVLAAAWIQFQLHDWVSHGHNDPDNVIQVPIDPADTWPERPMVVRKTGADRTRPAQPASPVPTFQNHETHWWDGSQIYGSNVATLQRVRAGHDGKLTIGADRLLPVDADGIEVTGVSGNWWVGLGLLHTVFTLEHNAICDRLQKAHPHWSDDELFDHARLVNAAVMAKIHTVEWTPGIIATPTIDAALNGNWNTIRRSKPDHHAAPYSLTEEFVAVYRMHPLIPDEFQFSSHQTGALLQARTLENVLGDNSRQLMTQLPVEDLLYSFGTSHPGAITLHNYPRLFQRFQRPHAPLIDLGAVDILRDRERGVPRYNRFRRLFNMDPVRSFDELTDNPTWAEEIRRVYDGDIERVDLMVGLFAEPLPANFGFSETAFRVFLLMASRRLQSDRFFTSDYREEIYSKEGLQWIEEATMARVLLRHYPKLARALGGVKHAFAPWNKVPAPAGGAAATARPAGV
jgi:hypothetical protein